MYLQTRKIFCTLQEYGFHQHISQKSYRAKGSVFTEYYEASKLPTLDKQSEYSTPPGNVACKDPSTTPCPVAIIGARTTSTVDLHPIMVQLINPRTKLVCSGRRLARNASHVIKARTESRKLNT